MVMAMADTVVVVPKGEKSLKAMGLGVKSKGKGVVIINKEEEKKKKGEEEVNIIREVYDLEDETCLYTPISCRGRKKEDAISVEQYTEERDLHKSIMGSMLETQKFIDLSMEDDDDCVCVEEEEVKEVKPFSLFGKKIYFSTEKGESSNSSSRTRTRARPDDDDDVVVVTASTFVCEICVEPKLEKERFKVKGCSHSFCSDCMSRYVASKLQENETTIGCPEMNCQGVLEPEYCRSILPPQVFDRWGDALCEALILGSQKFYCPYKDCSALLMDDGGMMVQQSECPNCWRLFCAQCKVPWHSDISCEEFQKLNKDERGREDIMLKKLADKSKWQRCPKCKIYVERIDGCLFMKCRCKFTFCYNCAAPMADHYCSKCKH